MLRQVPSSALLNVHDAAERTDIEANFSSGLNLTSRDLFLGSGHEQPVQVMGAGKAMQPYKYALIEWHTCQTEAAEPSGVGGDMGDNEPLALLRACI